MRLHTSTGIYLLTGQVKVNTRFPDIGKAVSKTNPFRQCCLLYKVHYSYGCMLYECSGLHIFLPCLYCTVPCGSNQRKYGISENETSGGQEIPENRKSGCTINRFRHKKVGAATPFPRVAPRFFLRRNSILALYLYDSRAIFINKYNFLENIL